MEGILNIYKEKGYTSHDVVAKLRGILKQKRIGHTGTLDPDAVGVLPVCIGKATKVCDMITNKRKTYQAVLQLGVETDTQDMTGTVLSEIDVTVKETEIRSVILSFLGEYSQIPPMYSAIKVNGKKLYELARKGQVIERKPREVFIYSIDIQNIDMQNKQVCMMVECSKGTYIRTLCHDIGNKLGCKGAMSQLTRIKAGDFTIEDSLTLLQVEQYVQNGTIEDYLRHTDYVFRTLKKVLVQSQYQKLVENGNKLKLEQIICIVQPVENEQVRVYNANERFIGIYQLEENNILKPVKLFI